MDCHIDAPIEQCIFELFGEHSLAADHREWIVLHVTCGLNDFDTNIDLRIQEPQALARLFSLPECEFGTARADDERARHRSLLETRWIFGKVGGVRFAGLVKATHLADDRM